MSVRNLDALFAPQSVAVIGASNRVGSVGAVVMRNLLHGGFTGPIMPVHPHYGAVAGVLAYPDVRSLPQSPDLAVICSPAPTVPGLVAELAQRGTRAAIVVAAGLGAVARGADGSAQEAMLHAARPALLRILGPNCLGLLVPGRGLNASFAHVDALPGQLAFVSQSGAFCTAVLDWARARSIGFSHFVSLGDSADVDVGDVLDYLGADPGTRAILLYVEAIRGARKQLSAARAAARNKPVLVLKAGRVREGARAATSHTGALASSDAVYEAAIARTGMLRVLEIEELFDAAETLHRMRPLAGERLAILTNGGGPGVTATDALIDAGGTLAQLEPRSLEQLDRVLPPTWSRANPVDIIGDAPAERFRAALEILLGDPGVDAVLVLHSPTALASSSDAARAVASAAAVAHRSQRNVITAWLGAETAEPARRILRDAGLPCFDTPYSAVRSFLHMVRYRRNQELLLETPASLVLEREPDVAAVRCVFDAVRLEQRVWLHEAEAKLVLAAYGIAIVPTQTASDADGCVRAAQALGFPVVLKIVSPDVTHKSDVGGVALDLADAEQVRRAAGALRERFAELRPDAHFAGYTVQPMVRRPGAQELIAGVTRDPVFGPVMLFGEGGTDVEVIRDRALGLPPLNAVLARELVLRTRIARRLAASRGRPAADLTAVVRALVQLSQLQIDFPEIEELDVNPLLADARGVLALDARIRISTDFAARDRLAIRPYPRALEERLELPDGHTIWTRPVRPEDEPAHRAFFEKLTPEDIYFRFFGAVRHLPHSQLARQTQIDYDREMAFLALCDEGTQSGELLGVVRAVADSERERAEFAIVVRSDWKGRGIGHALVQKLIRYCRARGIGELVGQVLAENRRMLDFTESLGFRARRMLHENTVEVRLVLARPEQDPGAAV